MRPVIVELLAKATRLLKAADWRPPPFVVKQPYRATLRWAVTPRARPALRA